MDITEAIANRRSIRRYTDRPVERAQLEELVRAARMAPSSMNTQPWHFTVTTGAPRDKVVEVVSRSTVYLQDVLTTMDSEHRAMAERFVCDLGGAPVIILVSVPKGEEEFKKLNTLLAAGGAIQNLQLRATELGLGVCNITFAFWVRDDLASAVDLPDDYEVASIVIVGYPDESPSPPGRHENDADFMGFQDA